MTMPFVVTYSFEAVLKDGLSVFQNSRPYVVKASKLFGLKIYFQTFPSIIKPSPRLRQSRHYTYIILYHTRFSTAMNIV